MGLHDLLDQEGDLKKPYPPFQKKIHGHFVGPVQDGRHAAPDSPRP